MRLEVLKKQVTVYNDFINALQVAREVIEGKDGKQLNKRITDKINQRILSLYPYIPEREIGRVRASLEKVSYGNYEYLNLYAYDRDLQGENHTLYVSHYEYNSYIHLNDNKRIDEPTTINVINGTIEGLKKSIDKLNTNISSYDSLMQEKKELEEAIRVFNSKIHFSVDELRIK